MKRERTGDVVTPGNMFLFCIYSFVGVRKGNTNVMRISSKWNLQTEEKRPSNPNKGMATY